MIKSLKITLALSFVIFLVLNAIGCAPRYMSPYSTKSGSTPLMEASSEGNVAKVKSLLTAGADPNFRNNEGKTALHAALDAATNEQKLDVIQILVDKGSDVNARDHEGRTPLLYAIFTRQEPEIVRRLLVLGADLNVTKGAWNALEWDYILDRVQRRSIAKVLLEHGAKPTVNTFILGLLPYNQDILHDLLDRGVDPNQADPNGLTILLVAAFNGFTNRVEILLKHGANVNYVTPPYSQELRFRYDPKNPAKGELFPGSMTALHFAAMEGHNTTVDMLLNYRANVDVANALGQTPLMLAVSHKHIEAMQSLVAKGASVNAKDDQGRTALMLAANSGHIEEVSSLLANNADLNAEDNKGRTAIGYAWQKGHSQIMRLLEIKSHRFHFTVATGKIQDLRAAVLIRGGDTLYTDIGKGQYISDLRLRPGSFETWVSFKLDIHGYVSFVMNAKDAKVLGLIEYEEFSLYLGPATSSIKEATINVECVKLAENTYKVLFVR